MSDSSFNIQNYFKKGKTVVLTLRQGDTDEVRQWSDKDTAHLLSLMNTYLPEFRNPRRRKKEVWADISKDLSDDGYLWTPEDCRKKWSNMVRTFKGIQEQKLTLTLDAKKKVKWPFYLYLLDLFVLEGADCLPEATSILQLLNTPAADESYLPTQTQPLQSQASLESARETVILADGQDMVGVAVDLASIINPGDEITTLHDGTLVENDASRQQEQSTCSGTTTNANANNNTNIRNEKRSSSYTTSGQAHQARRNPALKTYIRKSVKRKAGKQPAENAMTRENFFEKFIALTSEQNERILGQLNSFQENAVQLMRERNDVLKRLCTAIEQHVVTSSSAATQDSNNENESETYQLQELHEEVITQNQESQLNSQASTVSSYRISQNSLVPVLSSGTSGGAIISDSDHESLQGLISQDSSGSLTFHLDVPSNPSLPLDHNEMNSKVLRLENIPSDVNLSAFSATLHPTLVSSANSGRKPRSTLSKSVSVPLHTNRKIAPAPRK